MAAHIINLTGNALRVEAQRLLAAGADPNDAVECNGVRLNGPLEQIASPAVTVNTDTGRLTYAIKATGIMTSSPILDSPRMGVSFTCWTAEESKGVAELLTKLRAAPGRVRKRSYKAERAKVALRAVYGDPLPSPGPTPGEMDKTVNDWLARQTPPYERVSLKTIVEAAEEVRANTANNGK
jgi:hypothetical protein